MRYYYKVTLLADVVMSAVSSTEVSESLDYLSGSAFMGIAANYLFKNKPEEAFYGVFSSKIRFLDAHPLIKDKISYKIPLCLHKPKVKVEKEKEFYRFNGKPVLRKDIYPEDYKNSDEAKVSYDVLQMKQVRKGFFVANGRTWTKVEPEHQYTMKSSYDSENRRALDNALFGYDALVKGSEWVFVMEFDEDDKTEKIAEDLDEKLFNGKTQRIGKSKTSQYGNVKIEHLSDKFDYTCALFDPEIKERENDKCEKEKYKEYKVYADSRLCFFDENGQPTFQPTAEQLGFEGGEILWNKSFVRKYVFTPRNSTRKAYDGDIACIDKGSVFTVAVKLPSKEYKGRKVVGEYNSIGLGQIIVNPEFLKEEPKELKPLKVESETGNKDEANCNDPLFKWLDAKRKEKEAAREIAEKVYLACKAKDDNTKLWKVPYGGKEKTIRVPEGISASQWGVLRAKARTAIVKNTSWVDFEGELFSETKIINKQGKEERKGYLLKDRLLSKWSVKRDKLEEVCDEFYKILQKMYVTDEITRDIHQLRFFELLCAAAAKATIKEDKKGGE